MKKLCKHSELCQCLGKVTAPKITNTEICVDGIIYKMTNIGFSRHSDGNNKWYVYFSPYRRTETRRRITRMTVREWRKMANKIPQSVNGFDLHIREIQIFNDPKIDSESE